MAVAKFSGAWLIAISALALVLAGCGESDADAAGAIGDRKVRVVTTTNIIGDLARQIGGDRAEVTMLMGAGVDPHLYKASAGDVGRLERGDVIFYGGLELEGRMTDLFVELASERLTVPVAKDIPRDELSEPAAFAGKYDPHIWFDVAKWEIAAKTVADTLTKLDPDHADEYEARLEAYVAELEELDTYIRDEVETIPEERRVLVTSHDAFGYFGARYGLDVEAIQGVSTASEATTADIKRVAKVIAARKVNTVFLESSVPKQTIEAVLAEAGKRGQVARIGGELYADAAGKDGTEEGTYIGMVRSNVDKIVTGLS